MSRRATSIYVLICTILFIGLTLVYVFFPASSMDADRISRGFQNEPRLWMNGYMGYLFAFTYQGWIAAIGAAAAMYYLAMDVVHFRSMRILIYVPVFFLAFFLSYFAYINYRYHQTMLIFWIPFTVYAIQQIQPEKLRIRAYKICSLIVVLGFFFSLTGFFLPKYENRITQMSLSGSGEAPAATGEPFWQALDRIVNKDTVLCNNLPEMYHKSSCHGVFFWCGSLVYYNETGKHDLPGDISPEELKRVVQSGLHCRYIVSSDLLTSYNAAFEQLCQKHAKEVLNGPDGLVLYELND